MGWHNLKRHFQIGHIVQIREGRICIGSQYVSDLITVSLAGDVSWGSIGEARDGELVRYFSEMTADLAKVRELVAAPDTFATSLPVFTWDGADILELRCEEYGWPNPTHDGRMQYENTFSRDKEVTIARAKASANGAVAAEERNVDRAEKQLADAQGELAEARRIQSRLAAEYPTVEASS